MVKQIPWSSSKPLSAKATTTTAAAHPRSCLVQQHLSKPQPRCPDLAVTCSSLAWGFPAFEPQNLHTTYKTEKSPKLVKDQEGAICDSDSSLPWEELGLTT